MNTINVTSAPKTATFQMRINPEVKQRMEDIYARQGLSFTDAVNIFIQQSLNMEGLPFLASPENAEYTDGKEQHQQPIADGLHSAIDGHNGLPDGAALEGLGRFR